MAQSFKIKLEQLSDEEFAELLISRDMFSGKKLRLIDQEARNRYFSNKEFNGENDIYLNPGAGYVQAEKTNNIFYFASVSGVLLVVVLVFFIVKNFIKEDTDQIVTTDNELIVNQSNTIQENKPAIIQYENQNSNTNQDQTNVLVSVDKDKSQTVDLKQKSEVNPDPVISAEAKSNPDKNMTIEPGAAIADTEKQQIQVVEDKKAQITEKPKQEPSKTTISDKANSQKNQPDLSKKETPEKIAEQTKKKESITTKPSQNQNSKPHEFKIAELSTELMRQLVKFQNEWAFKQTSVKGVVDYYVDANVAIKFILSQPYSDSVSQYQQRYVLNLTGKYWKDLEKELGTQFPRTPMIISFVRFDAEF